MLRPDGFFNAFWRAVGAKGKNGTVKKIQEFIVKVASFFNEVGVELKKSAWPTRAELQESTLVVIVSVVLLGAFVGLGDLILLRVLNLIL